MPYIPAEYLRLLLATCEAAGRVIEARLDDLEPDPADLKLMKFARRRLPELRAGIKPDRR